MRNTRPGAVENYLEEVAREFERYAERTYPPALANPDAPDHLLLAAMRFVETRKVDGHLDTLKERFTSRRSGKHGHAVDEACLDALLATCPDQEDMARLLVHVGSLRRPLPTSDLCADALRRMGPVGYEAMLRDLATNDDGLCRRKLALMLSEASGVRMPEPLRFWKDADTTSIQAATDTWRAALITEGQLPSPTPPPSPADVDTNSIANVSTNGS